MQNLEDSSDDFNVSFASDKTALETNTRQTERPSAAPSLSTRVISTDSGKKEQNDFNLNKRKASRPLSKIAGSPPSPLHESANNSISSEASGNMTEFHEYNEELDAYAKLKRKFPSQKGKNSKSSSVKSRFTKSYSTDIAMNDHQKDGSSLGFSDELGSPVSSRDDGNSITSSSPPRLSFTSPGLQLLSVADTNTSRFDDRSYWVSRVQFEHPFVKDVRERVRPLARTLAFARSYLVKPQYPVADILTGQIPALKRSETEVVLGLVMQHLHAVGLQKTVSTLHQELDRALGHDASKRFFLDDSKQINEEFIAEEFDSEEDDEEESAEESLSFRNYSPNPLAGPSSSIRIRNRKESATHEDFSSNPSQLSTGMVDSPSNVPEFFHEDAEEYPEFSPANSPSSMDGEHLDYSDYAFVTAPNANFKFDLSNDTVDLSDFGFTPNSFSHLETTIQQQNSRLTHSSTPPSSSSSNFHGSLLNSSIIGTMNTQSANPMGSSSSSMRKQKMMEDLKHRTAILALRRSLSKDDSGKFFYKDQSFFENDRSETRLLTILRSAVRRAHEVWEMTVADKPDLSPDPIDSILEDKLYRLGLLEDEPEVIDDVDIWEEGADPEEDINGPNPQKKEAIAIRSNENIDTEMQAIEITDIQGGSKSRTIPIKSIAEAANKPPDPNRKLVYDYFVEVDDEEERPIRSATLNKLVEVATGSKLPDLNFSSIFLLTYRSFTTPRHLLEKLKQRFNVPFWIAEQRGLTIEEWRESIVVPIRLRVISFVKRWLTDYIEDVDLNFLPEVRKFVESMATADPNLKQHSNSILACLDRRAAHLSSMSNHHSRGGPVAFSTFQYAGISAYARFSPYGVASNHLLAYSNFQNVSTVSSGALPAPKIPKGIFDPGLTLYHIDQEEVARQLTILDSHVFISISSSELLNQSWNKPKLKHQAPNVLRTVAMFNQLSHAISYQILQGQKPKDRAKIIEWWIKVAEHCRLLNNFHALMAIISGVNSGPTARLRHSRKEVSKALLDQLAAYEEIYQSEGSFATYRTTLHNSLPPLIPYLGIHLTDLVFIEEGNKDTHGHLINFAKRRLLWGVISTLQTFQQTPYNLQPVRQIHDLLANLRTLENRELFKLSLAREPRERNQ